MDPYESPKMGLKNYSWKKKKEAKKGKLRRGSKEGRKRGKMRKEEKKMVMGQGGLS